MKLFKRFGIMMIAAGIVVCGAEIGAGYSIPGFHSLMPVAEAVVGRPLTPVSVAGVARRTSRRVARR